MLAFVAAMDRPLGNRQRDGNEVIGFRRLGRRLLGRGRRLLDHQQPGRTGSCFLDLPGEIRNKIYHLAVVYDKPLTLVRYIPTLGQFALKRDSIRHLEAVYHGWDVRNGRTVSDSPTGLLRVNKVISREACAIFCSENCFAFNSLTASQAEGYFQAIGSNNASSILHIAVSLRYSLDAYSTNISMLASPEMLDVIKAYCGNLTTLTVDGLSVFVQGRQMKLMRGSERANQGLRLVDGVLRTLPNLQEIIFHLDSSSMPLRPSVSQLILDLGWTLTYEPESDDSEDQDSQDGDDSLSSTSMYSSVEDRLGETVRIYRPNGMRMRIKAGIERVRFFLGDRFYGE